MNNLLQRCIKQSSTKVGNKVCAEVSSDAMITAYNSILVYGAN